METQNTKNRAIFLPTTKCVKQTLHICKRGKNDNFVTLKYKKYNCSGFPIKDFGNDSLVT